MKQILSNLLIILCLTTFAMQGIIGQTINIVPNPSFEIQNVCPNALGQIDLAIGWFSSSDGSPDYFNSCSNPGITGVPNNTFGAQVPFEGEAYAGFYAYGDDDQREYVGIELTEPLIPGDIYCIDFQVSLADGQFFGIQDIGMHFSNDPIIEINGGEVLNLEPHVVYQDSLIHDQGNWTTISGTYLAEEAFDWITIGNFYTNEETLGGGTIIGTPLSLDAYYYIDNVSIHKIEESLEISVSENICIGDVASISVVGGGGNTYYWSYMSNPDSIINIGNGLVLDIEGPVSLLVSSPVGECVVEEILILDPEPIPNIYFSALNSCIGTTTQFIDESDNVLPDALTIWEIEGNIDTLSGGFSYTFDTAGDYFVTLSIVNSQECLSSLTLPITIDESCDLCNNINNLVANPYFEIYEGCPSDLGQIDNLESYYTTTDSSPDFFHSCSTPNGTNWAGIPVNSFGSQEPLSGDGYAGLYIYENSNYREYISGALNETLNPELEYCVSMNVSLADTCGRASGNIGVYFSDEMVDFTTNNFIGVLPFTPQVNSEAPVNNKTDWTNINQIWQPESAHNFFTLGNFYNNGGTPTELLPEGNSNFSYYYIENIEITEIPQSAFENNYETCQGSIESIVYDIEYCDFHWISSFDSNDTLSYDNTLELSFNDIGAFSYIAVMDFGSCTKYDTLFVDVIPNPEAALFAENGCVDWPIALINTSTSTNSETIYGWDLNSDGLIDTLTSGSINHMFDIPGEYEIMLTVQNPGSCEDQASTTIVIEEDCDPCILQNLIVNDGFEFIEDCPSELGQLDLASGWIGSPIGAAHLFHSCNDDNVNVPNNEFGVQDVMDDGSAYGGFLAYAPNDQRSYVSTDLLFPLEVGQQYCVSMWVNLADESGVAIDFIGAYFSESIDFLNVQSADPQIKNEETEIIFGSNWTEITGSFIADDNSQYITIGNFNDNVETNALLQTGSLSETAIYYIDNISVAAVNIELSGPEEVCLGDAFEIAANSNMCEYYWTSLSQPGVILSDSSILEITASTSDTFIFHGSNNICENTDSFTIEVFDRPLLGDDIELCPLESIELQAQGVEFATEILWSPIDGLSDPTIANPVASPETTTTYFISANYEIETFCPNIDSITVNVIQPFANAGEDVILCLGDSVQLEASGGHLYNWSPEAGIDSANVATPYVFPIGTTTYSVTVTDTLTGCASTDEVLVAVFECDLGGPEWIDSLGNSNFVYHYDTTYQNIPDTIIIPELIDPDGELDSLIITFTNGANGIISLNGDSAIYLPLVDFVGNDTMTFIACDTLFPIQCDTFNLVITVLPPPNDAPVFNPENNLVDTVFFNTIDTICYDVFDPNDDAFQVAIEQLALNGGVSLLSDSCIQYSPFVNYLGPDQVIIEACDQDTCSYLIIDIIVLQNLIIANDDEYSIENGMSNSYFIYDNDTIPYSGLDTFTILSGPDHGSATIHENGVTYTPDNTFIGVDSLVYEICNMEFGCDTAVVYWNIANELEALDDAVFVLNGDSITIHVLDNDMYPEINCVELFITEETVLGTTAWDDFNIIYYAPVDTLGIDTLQYILCCENLGCDTAQILIQVTDVLPPVAVDDMYTIDQNTEVSLDVLLNDYDPNNESITITEIHGNAGGSFSIQNGEIVYQGPENFVGSDTLIYVICNESGFCDEGIIIIAIEEDCTINIVGGISPNSDNLNDYFVISGLYACNDFIKNEIKVYNRWGQIVFESQNYGANGEWWNGTWDHNDEPVPVGSYFYIVSSKVDSSTEELRGVIEIIR